VIDGEGHFCSAGCLASWAMEWALEQGATVTDT
jgi:hypothetical protein